MDEVQKLKELCDKMGFGKGEGIKLIAGYAELPQLFGLLGTVIERMEQRIRSLEQNTGGGKEVGNQ